MDVEDSLLRYPDIPSICTVLSSRWTRVSIVSRAERSASSTVTFASGKTIQDAILSLFMSFPGKLGVPSELPLVSQLDASAG